jgi:hypothetical protein
VWPHPNRGFPRARAELSSHGRLTSSISIQRHGGVAFKRIQVVAEPAFRTNACKVALSVSSPAGGMKNEQVTENPVFKELCFSCLKATCTESRLERSRWRTNCTLIPLTRRGKIADVYQKRQLSPDTDVTIACALSLQRAFFIEAVNAERTGKHAAPALDSPHSRWHRRLAIRHSLLPSAKVAAYIAPPGTSSPSRCLHWLPAPSVSPS